MAKITLSRPPQTEDELWWVIKTFFGVELPRKSVCPDHVSPFDAVAHAFFGREPNYAVWYASRGSGKSLALAVLGLTKSFVMDVDVTILGGSMTQSKNVATHMAKLMAHENAPVYAMEKRTVTELKLHTQRTITPLPASQTTVRGPHPPLQLLDEVDEMDLEIYDASMGQAMEQDNHWGMKVPEYIVVSSTWQNPEGTFTEVIDRARKAGQPIFTWCLAAGSMVTTDSGLVPIEDVAPGMKALTREGWREVTDAWCTGVRPTLRLELDDGSSLVATSDHLVATPSGYEPLGSLRPGSDVFTLTGSADAMTSVGAYPDVVGVGHVVATAADLSALSVGPGTPGVLAVGDRLQVPDVHTEPHAAQVVKDDLVLQRPDQPQPDGAMGVGGLSGRTLGDAVATTDGVGPDQALVGLDAELLPVDAVTLRHVVKVSPSIDQPVYDITVADAHEFVANGIVVHNCWRELLEPHGWMSRRFIDNKRKTVSAQMWKTEYELNEPSGASRAFDLDALEKVFVRYPKPLEAVKKGESYQHWVWEKYSTSQVYVVGADWAKERDFTVISVVNVTAKPYRLAKLIRVQRRPYPEMIRMFNGEVSTYAAISSTHDKTGLGNVVHDFLDFSDTTEGFTMVGRPRTQMLLDYIVAVEHEDFSLPLGEYEVDGQVVKDEELALLKRAHRATTVADVYAPGKWDGHLPDETSSMALANRALARISLPTSEDSGVPKSKDPRRADAGFHVEPPVAAQVGEVVIVDETDAADAGDMLLWIPAETY